MAEKEKRTRTSTRGDFSTFKGKVDVVETKLYEVRRVFLTKPRSGNFARRKIPAERTRHSLTNALEVDTRLSFGG